MATPHTDTPAARASAAPGAPLKEAPESILDAGGAPRLGAFAGIIDRADEIGHPRAGDAGGLIATLTRARWKRWIYVFVGGPEVMAGFAVADVGYLGNAFGYAYDRARGGERLEVSWLTPGALGVRIEGGLSAISAVGKAGARRLAVRSEGVGLRLEAALDGLRADLRVERLDTPLTVVSELDGPSSTGVTIKSAGLPVSGSITLEGRRFDLAGSLAVVDWTCARFGYRTDWNWASMTGRDRSGRPVGLNLCRGVHDATRATGHTENALWLEGRPGRLPRVEVEVGRGRAPWRITGGGKVESASVDLEFRPLGERSEDVNLGLVVSRFRQPYGTYHGVVRDALGRTVEIDGAPGVVEDHHARW